MVKLIDSATNTSNRVFSNNQIEFSRMQLMKISWISHDFLKKKKSHDFPRLCTQFLIIPMILMTLWTPCTTKTDMVLLPKFSI